MTGLLSLSIWTVLSCSVVAIWIAPAQAAFLHNTVGVSHARCPPVSPSFLHASKNNNNNNNNKKQDDAHRTLTLYDVLGASPTDTTRQLKLKYTALVKKLHPDVLRQREPNKHDNDNKKTNHTSVNVVVVDNDNNKDAIDFSQVNAAWRVLGDPKERLRYDRSLKAKQFTDDMESWLEEGIKNAVPFLRKTADSTRAAVETVGGALERMEVETKIRDLEQQASRDVMRVAQIKTQLETMEERRLSILTNTNNKNELTSAEASRILESFHVEEAETHQTDADIASLQQVEVEYRESLRERIDSERAVRNAERSREDALLAEQQAVERIEEAKRALAAAKVAIVKSKQASKDAAIREKASVGALDNVAGSLERHQEKVKISLRKNEGLSMQREAVSLEKEREQLEIGVENIKAKANKLKQQAEEMRRLSAAKAKE